MTRLARPEGRPARSATSAWVPGERIARRRGEPAVSWPSDGPKVGVLALQGDVLEHLRALADVGAAPVRVRDLDDLDGLEAIVIPGGESTTIGRLLVLHGLLEPLRRRVAEGLPTLGTCAGLILLSAAVADEDPPYLIGGLDVTTRRNAFGRQVDSFETRLEVGGVEGGPLDGGPLEAVFIRAPWVERLGPDVEVLASVDGRPVLVRQGPVIGAAFHPELTGERRLHRLLLTAVAS